MKIGLVGEDPNDTSSIKNLLKKEFLEENYEYLNLLNNITGSLLDSQKTKRFLRREFESLKPDIVVFIRDLDGIEANNKNATFKKRKLYFSESNRIVNGKGILLLNVFEIEALIFADIEKFDNHYDVQSFFDGNCMAIPSPKEELRKFSNKYNESHNPEIFELLDYNIIISRCRYFENFIKRFNKLIDIASNK